MIMPNLLLQQTTHKATTAENKKTLERRLTLWREKKISHLIGECLVIQIRLENQRKTPQENLSKSFNKLMMLGKVNAAIRLLSKSQNSGVLPLSEVTMQQLHLKHPEAQSTL